MNWLFAPRNAAFVAVAAAGSLFVGCGSAEQPRSAAPSNRTESRPLDAGGPAAFKAFLRDHRGRSIVVNQWASWCRPCREEFPIFRVVSERLKGRVVFVGVAAKDSRSSAAAFLRASDPGFPQFLDPDGEISRLFRGGRVWPTTAFYLPDGTMGSVQQGPYASAQALTNDINRYAIDG